jgi:hypothetical protein
VLRLRCGRFRGGPLVGRGGPRRTVLFFDRLIYWMFVYFLLIRMMLFLRGGGFPVSMCVCAWLRVWEMFVFDTVTEIAMNQIMLLFRYGL